MNLGQIKFLLPAGILCLLFSQNSRAQEQEYDRDNWTYDHFPPVFKEVFPFAEEAEVSFRIHGDYENDILEYSLSFMKKTDNSIEVVVRVADTVPVFLQLMRLHLKNRGASAESFSKRLKVKDWRLNDQTCPDIKTRLSKFDELSLPVSSKEAREAEARGEALIILHPTIYDFKGRIWGGRLNLGFEGPDDEHPLMRWMDETLRVLDKCISGNSGRTVR